jgi:ribonuclease Z
MRLTLLGTGCPQADPQRTGPASLVRAGEAALLIDCGSFVSQRLVQAGAPGKAIDALLLTHLHSDHVVDFHQLVVSSWHQGRQRPWRVFGPPGTRAFVERSFALWRDELDFRIAHERRPSTAGLAVEVTEFADGDSFTIGDAAVTPVKVNHDPFPETYGFVIEHAGRKLVFSADTIVWPPLIEASRNADCLVHEVFILREMPVVPGVRNEATRDAVAGYHTLSTEVGRVAAAAQVGCLVLNHLVPTRFDAAALVADVRAHFAGPLIVGEDLLSYDLATRVVSANEVTLGFPR